jgi:hypothetical protein
MEGALIAAARRMRAAGRVGPVLVLLALALSGCLPVLFDDSCGPEFRHTVVGGDIRDPAGARLGHTEVRLTEVRDGSPTLHTVLMGPAYANPGPLSRHIVRVRLLGADGAVLRDFAFRHGNEHEIIWITAEELGADAVRGLKSQLAAGAQLEIETDLAGMERIRVPLRIIASTGWSRASCS